VDFNELLVKAREIHDRCDDVEIPAHETWIEHDSLHSASGMAMPMTDWVWGQYCSRMKIAKWNGGSIGIPADFLRSLPGQVQRDITKHVAQRMPGDKELFIRRIANQHGSKRVRGVLSDKYTPYSNKDLIETVATVMNDGFGRDVTIESHHFTDVSFHLRLLFPDFKTFVRTPDDQILGGIHISNSEVGFKKLNVQWLLWRQICTNGMVGLQSDAGYSRKHIGAGWDDVRPLIMNIITNLMDKFDEITDRIRELAERKIQEEEAERVVQLVGNGFNQDFNNRVLIELNNSKDFTNYGVLNAFTHEAKMENDPDIRLKVEETITARLLKAA